MSRPNSQKSSCSANGMSSAKPWSLASSRFVPAVPKRSSSYHYAARTKKSCSTLRSFRSGTAMHAVLLEKLALPSRTSSLRFIECPITPSRKSPAGLLDPCPFPLTPSPLCSPPSSTTTSNGSSQGAFSRINSYQTPPTSPDRYVPTRKSRDSLAKSYRLSKPPSQLTPSERIMRHSAASRDPFRRRRLPRAHPTPRSYVPPVNTRPIRQGSFGILPSPRAASAGAIWNVGGALPPSTFGPVAGVSDGRGGVLGSGTNAPMFTSDFLNPDTTRQSSERFEGRLAVALDIDQTARILNFQQSRQECPNIGARGLRIGDRGLPGLVWRDSRWSSEINEHSGQYGVLPPNSMLTNASSFALIRRHTERSPINTVQISRIVGA